MGPAGTGVQDQGHVEADGWGGREDAGPSQQTEAGEGGTSMTAQWVLPLSSTNVGLVSEVESIAKT